MSNDTGRSVAGLPLHTAVVFVLLFAAALAIYTALWRQTPAIDGDTPQYQEVARDLVNGRLETLHDRSVGYPLLLAVTGAADAPTWQLLVVSLCLHFASIWMLARVLLAAAVSRRWVVAFGVLLLLPPFAEPAAWVMTENLAQFMLVAGFTCLVLGFSPARIGLLAAASLAVGYAALTRPVYQALACGLAALVLALPAALRGLQIAYRDTIRAAVVLVAGSSIILGGMSYVNFVKFNYFGVVPSLGFHLSTKTWALYERLPDEVAAVRDILVRGRNAELAKRGSAHTGTQTIWEVRPELEAATGLSKPQLSSLLLKWNLWLIRNAPLEYLLEVARSMATYWFPAATPLASMHVTALRWLWTTLHAAWVSGFFLQIIVLTGVAVFSASRSRAGQRAPLAVPWAGITVFQSIAWIIPAAIVVYTMLLSCFIDIGDPRQRRPTDVLVIFLCVLGAHVWRQSLHARDDGRPVRGLSVY